MHSFKTNWYKRGIATALALLGLMVMPCWTSAQDLELQPLSKQGNPRLANILEKLQDRFDNQGLLDAKALADMRRIRISNSRVRLIVETENGILPGLPGVQVEGTYKNLVQVLVPLHRMRALAALGSINMVRLPRRPLLSAVSQGVNLTGANTWHGAGYIGQGTKVAILDLGFSGYGSLLGTELPSTVTAKSFYGDPGGNGDITGSGEVHGTACAEIVYDMAPGSDLYLVNYGTEVEMGNAVDWLIAQGVDIITHSVGWVNMGPYDGTGTICDMVNDAHAAGIFWSNSAGNQAQRHYEGTFTDSDTDGSHEFAPGDETINISASFGQTIAVYLGWNDWPASSNDYDLYLYHASDLTTPVAGSVNWQTGTQPPTEGINYVASQSGTYHLEVRNFSASGTHHLEVYSFTHNLEHKVLGSSLLIPADADGSVTVGATYWGNDNLESFSSRGPTNGPGGGPAGGITKPDLTAPDGVSSSTYGSFYGTSASSPHVAGAAAVHLSKDSTLTADQLQANLEADALDLGSPGKDDLFGSGRLRLLDPAPPPTLTSISVGPTSVSIAAGQTQQFTATGTYSDSSTADITATTTWTSSVTAVATINTSGLATGVAAGTSSITASQAGVTSNAATLTVTPSILTSISVTPVSASIAGGQTQQYTATGTYSDSSTADITATATWTSSVPAIATIAPSGLATGVSAGTTSITASQAGVTSNATTLTVTPSILTAISVTPVSASIAAGQTQQYTATGTYSDSGTADITTTATWTSLAPAVATIAPSGLAMGVAAGTTGITASQAGVTSNTATLTVTPSILTSISVTPTNTSIQVGQTQQYTAIGTYTDLSTADITTTTTWASSVPAVATIGPSGLATGVAAGTSSITASQAGVTSNAATLDVIALPTVLSIETGFVGGVGNSGWTTVFLNGIYNSMVVVCSPNYDKTMPPGVVRVRNAGGNSFEVRADSTDGITPISGVTVFYMVVEEGVYTAAEHGVNMEAVKFTSTVTDRKGSWNGESRAYSNGYFNPVVVGQVMTYNDPKWSTFWCRSGSSSKTPPNGTLRVGKHVGGESQTGREPTRQSGTWSSSLAAVR